MSCGSCAWQRGQSIDINAICQYNFEHREERSRTEIRSATRQKHVVGWQTLNQTCNLHHFTDNEVPMLISNLPMAACLDKPIATRMALIGFGGFNRTAPILAGQEDWENAAQSNGRTTCWIEGRELDKCRSKGEVLRACTKSAAKSKATGEQR